MLMNARKEADLINPATNTPLELDIFLPSLHLAFEFQVIIPPFPFPSSAIIIILNREQDKSHYFVVDLYNRIAGEVQSLDQLKQQLATEKGITLIPIPFWWDGTKSR